MAALEQARRFWENLMKLGTRRLIGLGVTGLMIFLVTGLAGYYLSRPTQELLYSAWIGKTSAASRLRSRKPISISM